MEDVSVPAAFGAGIASFLSPCVLPLVPVYLASLAGASSFSAQVGAGRRAPVLHALCFVAGFSIVFVALGASAGVIGTVASADLMRKIAGAMLLVFGLLLLATPWVPWLNYEKRFGRMMGGGAGYMRSVLVGVAFSLGWTPCIGLILGGILALASSSQTAWHGAYLLGVYSLGLGVPFIAAGLALGTADSVTRWLSRRSNIISLISGILLIVLGILMFTNKLVGLSL